MSESDVSDEVSTLNDISKNPQRKKRARRKRTSKTRRRGRRVRKRDENYTSEVESDNNPSDGGLSTKSALRRTRRRKSRERGEKKIDPDSDDNKEEEAEKERIEKQKRELEEEEKKKAEIAEMEIQKELKRMKKIKTVYNVRQKMTKIDFALGENLYLTKNSERRPVMKNTIENMKKKISIFKEMGEKFKNIRPNTSAFVIAEKEKIEKDVSVLEKKNSKLQRLNTRIDGIFNGNKPVLLSSNENILMQRCIRSKPDDIDIFFDRNGNFLSASDPISRIPTRPNDFFDEFEEDVPLEPTIPFIIQNLQVNAKDFFILDFECNEIIFDTHPLMNQEEYYSKKLKFLFGRYMELKRNNLVEYFRNRISALRQSLQTFRSEFNKYSPNFTKVVSMKSTLSIDPIAMEIGYKMSSLRAQLKATRNDLESELHSEIQYVNSIIKIWNLIKNIRIKNKYSTTNLKVEFSAIKGAEKSVEEEEIEKLIKQEIFEIEEGIMWEYKKEMQEYYKIIENDVYNIEKPNKPKIVDFDVDEEREKIRKRLLSKIKKPGLPMIIPRIKKQPATSFDKLPAHEQERQNKLKNLRYFAKLFINGGEVSKTKPTTLSKTFGLNVSEIIPISVLKWPDSIKIEIREKGSLSSWHIAELNIPERCLDFKELNDDMQGDIENLPATKKRFEKIRFEGENSFVPLYVQQEQNAQSQGPQNVPNVRANGRKNDDDRKHTYTGSIAFRLAWTSKEKGQKARAPPVPSNKRINYENSIPTATDLLDLEKMKKWLKGNLVDPSDPRNTGILSMFELIENRNLNRKGFYLTEQNDSLFLSRKKKKIFKTRHDELEDELEDDQEEVSGRVETVSRYVNEPLLPTNIFKFFSWIFDIFTPRRPLKPDRYKKDDLSALRSRNMGEKHKVYIQIIRAINVPTRVYDKDSQMSYRKKKFSMYKTQQLKRYTSRRLRNTVDNEDENEEEGGFENSQKKPRNEPGVFSEVSDGDVVSDIKKEIEMEEMNNPSEGVHSFVEVFFQNCSKRTIALNGSSPHFNEVLELPFKMENDNYSPDNVMEYNELIYFDFFDLVEIETPKDERQIRIEKRRREERFLGSFSIPFSTLYTNSKIYGTFNVKTPDINNGYKVVDGKRMKFSINMTIRPLIPAPDKSNIRDIKVSGESPELTMYLQWFFKTKKRFSRTKDRVFRVLAPNLYGKGTLVCRYICPQKPPEGITTDFLLLRYVSLIPFFEDILVFKERTEVWTNSQQFIDKGGDEEEHAILLCNYFLYRGKNAYVIMGNAIPEGETCYVLTIENSNNNNNKDKNVGMGSNENENNTSGVNKGPDKKTDVGMGMGRKCLLWNPSSGEVYDQYSSECPLTSIGCIFNDKNLWINMQNTSELEKMNFNIGDKYSWEPLFTKKNFHLYNKKVTIQTPLVYNLSNFQTLKIESKLVTKIKAAISRERVDVCHFESSLVGNLKRILKELEECKCNKEKFNEMKQVTILGDEVTKNMFGYPLNFKKIEVKKVVREVLNTKIHEIGAGESNISFAVSSYVKIYPNNVQSIWVYVAVIFQRI